MQRSALLYRIRPRLSGWAAILAGASLLAGPSAAHASSSWSAPQKVDATEELYSLSSTAIAVQVPVQKPPIRGAAASAHSSQRAALVHAVGELLFGMLGGYGGLDPCRIATHNGIAAIREDAWLQDEGLPTTTRVPGAPPENGFLPTLGCRDAVNISNYNHEEGRPPHYPADLNQSGLTVQAIHISGHHARVRVAPNWPVSGRGAITGGELPVSTSWLLRGGRWLFDDKPTGVLSRAGQKAASKLRAALIDHTVTVTDIEGSVTTRRVYGLCADGTSSLVTTYVLPGLPTTVTSPQPGLWYVGGGIRGGSGGRFVRVSFNPPQGVLFSNNESQLDGPQANVTLVGGAIKVASYLFGDGSTTTPTTESVTVTLTQGASGC